MTMLSLTQELVVSEARVSKMIDAENVTMIDAKKLRNHIKAQINPYGKPFEGTVYDFGLKLMDYIDAMEKYILTITEGEQQE